MRLVVVVGVAWRLNRILNKFLESRALADKFEKFGDAAATAKHYKFLLLAEKLLDSAAVLLVQKLVDLDVSSTGKQAAQLSKSFNERPLQSLPAF